LYVLQIETPVSSTQSARVQTWRRVPEDHHVSSAKESVQSTSSALLRQVLRSGFRPWKRWRTIVAVSERRVRRETASNYVASFVS
jgi:hypothetical protein